MSRLVALDLPLGPELQRAIADCYHAGEAFSVLDQRWSELRRRDMLSILRPHVVQNSEGFLAPPDEPLGIAEGDGAVVLTSGTSGRPRAAVLTWDALTASAQRTSLALRRGGPTRWFASLPPVHIGGCAVVVRALLTDDELIFGTSDELLAGPPRGATHCAVVTTQLHRYDLSHYACVLVGGGPAPHDRPANVVSTYGSTETGSGVVYDGKPLEGVRVREKDGELLIASPTLLRSYRHSDVDWVLDDHGTRWFPTGDGGRVNDAGTVSVSGRLAYVINTGGEKVWPEDLESVMEGLIGVTDLAVVGEEDAEWGQRVVVAAVTRRDPEAVLADLRAVAREHLGPWARPSRLVVLASIPRTANGKVRRDLLATLI